MTLRAVAPRKTPSKPQCKTVSQAAEDNDRRGELVAMRARLARAIDDPETPPRDLASLTRRQLEIGREIETIDAAEVKTDVSDEQVTDSFDASAI